MTDATVFPATPLRRHSTGIPGLDKILVGGLFQGGTYLISGTAGAGKTVLANQFSFNHVAAGGRAIYITVLGAEHARMLSYLQSFQFYHSDVIGDDLIYLSAYSALEQQGLDSLQQIIQRSVRDHRATLLVIDALGPAEDFAESPLAFQKFIRSVQVLGVAMNCTVVMLSLIKEGQAHAEYAPVDGIIELRRVHKGQRVARELEVIKFRGSTSLKGSHFFSIVEQGVVVLPRLEVLLNRPSSLPSEPQSRKAFGIPRLDEMLRGGLPSGSITMLLGAPGTGKTPFGAAFLNQGAGEGEAGLLFGFYESPPRLVNKVDQMGFNMGRYVNDGTIEIFWQPPIERNLDMLAQQLLEMLDRRPVRRLFIDGMDGFQQAALYTDRLGPYLTALANELRGRDVTTIFTVETEYLFSSQIEVPLSSISATVDNILLLRHAERRLRLHRLLAILKARGTLYDPSIYEFNFTESGIELAPVSVAAGETLSDHDGLS